MTIKEFIFVGTGTSGNVPNIYCLTSDPITCKVCLQATQICKPILEPFSDNHSQIITFDKNKRRNTSALLRYLHSDGNMKNILIDCGKTFYESALLTFTSHKLRRIDAVILTHSHADAILGLDDLRQWTMNSRIQDAIDIYLNADTFEGVKSVFPYMVNKANATGGGEVATLRFHVFDSNGMPENFQIDELNVIPIPVQHGIYSDGRKYMSMGYRFGNLTYISDVNDISDDSMKKIEGSEVLVVDALKGMLISVDLLSAEPHASHFSYGQALDLCLQILPKHGRGYMTGLCHNNSHDEVNNWVRKNQKRIEMGIHVEVAYDNQKIDI